MSGHPPGPHRKWPIKPKRNKALAILLGVFAIMFGSGVILTLYAKTSSFYAQPRVAIVPEPARLRRRSEMLA